MSVYQWLQLLEIMTSFKSGRLIVFGWEEIFPLNDFALENAGWKNFHPTEVFAEIFREISQNYSGHERISMASIIGNYDII